MPGTRYEMTNDDGAAAALLWACREGHAGVVAAILPVVGDVAHTLACVDDAGSTPLLLAAWMGHAATVAQLVVAMADLNTADDDGATPLLIACAEGHLGKWIVHARPRQHSTAWAGHAPRFMFEVARGHDCARFGANQTSQPGLACCCGTAS